MALLNRNNEQAPQTARDQQQMIMSSYTRQTGTSPWSWNKISSTASEAMNSFNKFQSFKQNKDTSTGFNIDVEKLEKSARFGQDSEAGHTVGTSKY